MADTIKIEIEGNESLEIKCATCSNGIPLFRGRKFPICEMDMVDIKKALDMAATTKVAINEIIL
jgi:hypothetical protein